MLNISIKSYIFIYNVDFYCILDNIDSYRTLYFTAIYAPHFYPHMGGSMYI